MFFSSILARQPPGLMPAYQNGSIFGGWSSSAGKRVSEETAKNVATAYRCINVISDDVAKIPLQTFCSPQRGIINRIQPDAAQQNIPYLLEVRPNRYQTPFIFKKSLMQWLLGWGNGYVWLPLPQGGRREMFILRGDSTSPYYDRSGNLWYRTVFDNGEVAFLPDVEVMPLMINSLDGLYGRSVIEYARESIGRQLGAYETQGKMYAQGLNPSGIMWINGEASPEARDTIRTEFEKKMGGSQNAYRLAVMDSKVQKFEPITMKPIDIQFLQGISATDVEICNFFGVPLNKVNQGKQSYNSNEQNNLDYLGSTLDPYLVQIEQAARIKWIPEDEQGTTYQRFYRKALLQIDAAARADVNVKEIACGVTNPNEAREDQDQSGYPEGGKYWMTRNNSPVDSDFFKNGNGGGTNGRTQNQNEAGTGA